MKIITEPTVQLISRPQFIPLDMYELPEHSNELDNIIATGGKVCYDTFGKDGRSVKDHVQGLGKQGHGSVLEHVSLGLFIAGISRGCSHELVRHRHFSYSQRSTRYTAEEDAAIVLDPYYAHLYRVNQQAPHHLLPSERELVSEFLGSADLALAGYQRQLNLLMSLNPDHLDGVALRKWARGKARQLLPHALETRMVMTGNVRAWRHFVTMRTSRHAEAEIRRLASQVWGILLSEVPNAVADAKSNGMWGGYEEVICPTI